MTTLINAGIILGAPAIPLLTIMLGFGCFYAEPPAMWAGLLLLAAIVVYSAAKRAFAAMWLYLAAALILLVIYPKLEGLESYNREGRIRGMLSELRVKISGYKARTGQWPMDGAILGAPAFDLRQGHKTSAGIETFALPPSAYLRPPENSDESLLVKVLAAGSGEERLQYWNRGSLEPVLMYPGGAHSYIVRREKDNVLFSSGMVNVPVPPGFRTDSGGLLYDPATGRIFINCAHTTRQSGKPWWWF